MIQLNPFKVKVISTLSLITFVIIWQLVCTFKLVSPILLPSPLQILDTVLDLFKTVTEMLLLSTHFSQHGACLLCILRCNRYWCAFGIINGPSSCT